MPIFRPFNSMPSVLFLLIIRRICGAKIMTGPMIEIAEKIASITCHILVHEIYLVTNTTKVLSI